MFRCHDKTGEPVAYVEKVARIFGGPWALLRARMCKGVAPLSLLADCSGGTGFRTAEASRSRPLALGAGRHHGLVRMGRVSQSNRHDNANSATPKVFNSSSLGSEHEPFMNKRAGQPRAYAANDCHARHLVVSIGLNVGKVNDSTSHHVRPTTQPRPAGIG